MDLTRACTTTPPPVITKSVDFVFYRGTTFRAKFSFKTDTGAPINITNMGITFNVVNDQEVLLFSLNENILGPNGSTINVLNAINGEVEILITDEHTTLLTIGILSWWITLNPINGDKLLRGKGQIEVMNPY